MLLPSHFSILQIMAPPSIDSILERLADRGRRRLELPADGLARAAVLVPIVAAASGPRLLFTRRTDSVETHKGQVSFPGGAADPRDGSPEATALRETHEEVGIGAHDVQLAGRLDDIQTPTGFLVTPVAGILRGDPIVRPNVEEVAEVFTVPLAFFLDPSGGWTERRTVRGRAVEVWFYRHDSNVIWGATAAIVRSLVSTISP